MLVIVSILEESHCIYPDISDLDLNIPGFFFKTQNYLYQPA